MAKTSDEIVARATALGFEAIHEDGDWTFMAHPGEVLVVDQPELPIYNGVWDDEEPCFPARVTRYVTDRFDPEDGSYQLFLQGLRDNLTAYAPACLWPRQSRHTYPIEPTALPFPRPIAPEEQWLAPIGLDH